MTAYHSVCERMTNVCLTYSYVCHFRRILNVSSAYNEHVTYAAVERIHTVPISSTSFPPMSSSSQHASQEEASNQGPTPRRRKSQEGQDYCSTIVSFTIRLLLKTLLTCWGWWCWCSCLHQWLSSLSHSSLWSTWLPWCSAVARYR